MKRILQNMCMLLLILITATYSYSQQKTTVTDIDGNVYPVVEIGTQKWMGENLRASKFNNGDEIPNVQSVDDWTGGSYPLKWVNYDNDPTKDAVYGKLYDGRVATDERNICPDEWHVATKDDWDEMFSYLGGVSVAANKLMDNSGNYWETPNDATNETGFSAVPNGYRASDGSFLSFPYASEIWTSTKASSMTNNYVNIHYSGSIYRSDGMPGGVGRGIRCIKNAEASIPTLTTTTLTNTTQTTATSGGNITDDGGAEVTARGVCWSTTQTPTVTNSKTQDGTGVGEFTSNLTGLTANTTYYVRAYATNSAGTGYGNEVVFTTSSTTPFTEPEWVYLNEENVGIRGNATQQDSKGNIWFAGNGVITKYTTEGQVIKYQPTSGSIGTDYFVLENDNAMWTGNYIQGVSKFDGNDSWVHYNEGNSGLPTNYINYIAVDSKGNKWIATNGGGLAMFDDTDWTVYTKENSDLPDNTIYSIFIDKNDNVWLGLSSYLVKFDGTTWSTWTSTETDDGVLGLISAIAIDESDNIWIGKDHNLGVATASLTDLTSWTKYSYSNSDYPDARSISISFDEDGRVWFGTDNDELVIFDGSSWYNYNNVNSNWPSTHNIKSIFRDSKGNSWLSCIYGVVLVGEYVPTVLSTDATEITQTTAIAGGGVKFYGGAEVTARGVCWSTSQTPTIADSKTENGTGVGEFTSNLTGLTANTTYYVRAYATNSAGTGYGEQKEFTTSSAPVVPTLVTWNVTNITQTTASSGGTINDSGGVDITAKGVVWSVTTNPTLGSNDGHTENGTGDAEFTSELAGLTANTTYYVRAYATNSAGTGYGEQKEFTTAEEASVDPLPLPFTENFDGEVHSWIVLDLDDDGNKWGFFENTDEAEVAYSGTKCAGVQYNTSGNNDWLITPLLTLPADEEIEFSFWAKSQDPAYLESFDIHISTDGGENFTKVGSETDISASYTEYSYDLSNYAGQNVHIAIVCVSVDRYFLFVDDISCAIKGSTSSPITLPELNINAYPNPFTNNITVKSNRGIRRIAITNINGQVVMQKHINGEISKQINTGKLGSGLYLLQVIDLNGNSKHIKLVKP